MVDKAATVRAINKLEDLDYVRRVPDPEDKRSIQIFLTDKGKSLRPQLESIVSEVQAVLLANMSNEEQQLLHKLIKKMTSNIIEKVRHE